MTDWIDPERDYALTLLYCEDITADAARWNELQGWLKAQGWNVRWQRTRIPIARARFQLGVEPVLGSKVSEVITRLEPVHHSAIEFL